MNCMYSKTNSAPVNCFIVLTLKKLLHTTELIDFTELHCSSELHCLNSTELHSVNCAPSAALNFFPCPHESWKYPVADLFCQIFVWFVTLCALQLKVTIKHDYFLKLSLLSLVGIKVFTKGMRVFQPYHTTTQDLFAFEGDHIDLEDLWMWSIVRICIFLYGEILFI